MLGKVVFQMGLFSRPAARCGEPDRYFDCGGLLRQLDACPHDYRTRSMLTDRLYLLLLYRDYYPLSGRAGVSAMLDEQIEFFARLPRAKTVPRLEYLNALHRLYKGALAFCGGDMPAALEHYTAVTKLRCFRGIGESARLGKADAADFHELLPVVYNISQAFNLLKLTDRSRALYARYGDMVYLRRRELSEQLPHDAENTAELEYLDNPTTVCRLLLHPIRCDLREDFPCGYDTCCGERYIAELGKTYRQFHGGLASGAQAAELLLSTRDGEEFWQAEGCSSVISRKALITEQAAKVAVSYIIPGKEK